MNLAAKILKALLDPRHDNKLDMMQWHLNTPCGTTACLAGWACVFRDPDVIKNKIRRDAFGRGNEWSSEIETAAREIFSDEVGAVPDFYSDLNTAVKFLVEHSDVVYPDDAIRSIHPEWKRLLEEPL